MSVNKYVGARYIPKAADPILHDPANAYEHLMMVQDSNGGCWLSCKPVPPGVTLEPNEYWVFISDWDAQVAAYHQDVLAYNGRITDLENGLSGEITNRENADLALSGDIADEVTARENADLALSGDISDLQLALSADIAAREAIEADNWVTTNRIKDGAVTFDKLSEDLQNRNQCRDMLEDRNAYIDCDENVHDEDAEIGNPDKPFRTLDAAFAALDELGNNFRFTFKRAGAYKLTARVITGAVIHFFTNDSTQGDDVYIAIDNNAQNGGVFFYDTHVSILPRNGHDIHITAPQYIEFEGSTLWCGGDGNTYTFFDCKYLYLIDGSGQLAHMKVNNGYIWGKFGNIIFDDVVINNNQDHAAFEWDCGIVRCQGDSLKIARNTNASGKPGILLRSCQSNWNANTASLAANCGYERFMQTYGGVHMISDSLLSTMNGYASNDCSIAGVRVKSDTVIPA